MAAKLPKPKEFFFFLDRQRCVFELNINAMFFFFFFGKINGMFLSIGLKSFYFIYGIKK